MRKRNLFTVVTVLAILALAVIPVVAQGTDAVSDEFNGTALGSHWIESDPSNLLSVSGGKLLINLPSGTQRSLSPSNQDAPRIVQAVDDPQNFVATIKIDNPPNDIANYGTVGIVVLGTYDLPGGPTVQEYPTIIRASLDTYRGDQDTLNRINGWGSFFWQEEGVWTNQIGMLNGQPDATALTGPQSAGPIWLRLERETYTIPENAEGFTTESLWTISWSTDGTTFTAFAGSVDDVTHPSFIMTHIGVFAGVTGGNPAYNAEIDSFIWNEQVPGEVGVVLTKAVVGDDTLDEPGGAFTFRLTIANTSDVPVEITALTDDHPLSAECTGLIGDTIPALDDVSCEYTATFTDSNIYDNEASVTVESDTGVTASDTATASVSVNDVAPTVQIGQVAVPAVRQLPGGDFVYTVTITNTSVEPVTINALVDAADDPIAGECAALVSDEILAGGTAVCDYTVTHSAVGVFPHVAKVTVEDNESNSVTAENTTSVEVTTGPVLPTVVLEKTVDKTTGAAGSPFTYTLTITNTSGVEVTVTALTDDKTTLPAACTSLIGQDLATGAELTCQYAVTYPAAGSYTNTASVTVTDGEQEGSDTASVTVTVTGKAEYKVFLPFILKVAP